MMNKHIGEMVQVRDDSADEWDKRKLVAVLPKQYADRYICEHEESKALTLKWRYCEPIPEVSYPYFKKHINTGNVYRLSSEDGMPVQIMGDDIGYILHHKNFNVEDWVDIPYDKERNLWHGQPIMAYKDNWTHTRDFSFYSVTEECCFGVIGQGKGPYYDLYEPLPLPYPEWLIEAYKTLEGI